MRFHSLLVCLAAKSFINKQEPSTCTALSSSSSSSSSSGFPFPTSSFWNDDSNVSALDDPPPKDILKEIRDRPWKGGFEPFPPNGMDLHDDMLIEGKIPSDLEGTLFRNGPGRIRIRNNRYGHWFDGDGLVTSLYVNGSTQTATYAAKYVETERFTAQRDQDEKYFKDQHRKDDRGFASAGAWTKRGKNGGRFWESLFAIPTNPSNTNVLFLDNENSSSGGSIYALAEGGPPVEMNPLTLETIGETSFKNNASGDVARSFFSAHYKKDPKSDVIYNHGIELFPKPLINVMKIDGSSGNLIQQQTSELPMLNFVHDNALSEHYFILLVQPYDAPFSALIESVMGGAPLGKRFRWNNKNEKQQQQQKRNETLAMIYSKETLEKVAEVPLPLMSTYHHLDAFENDDSDVVQDNDDGKITTRRVLTFRTLAHDPPESRVGFETAASDLYSAPSVPRCESILEYVIDIRHNNRNTNTNTNNSTTTQSSRLLSIRKIATDAEPCELPERNWGWGYRTRYIYTNCCIGEEDDDDDDDDDNGNDDDDDVNVKREWSDSLQKVDLESGECSSVVSFGKGVYAGAPIFVPRQTNCDDDDVESLSKEEDDGYVFTQLYNSNNHSTDVCILDAVTMKKLAVLRLAKPVPFQFHGTWVAQHR